MATSIWRTDEGPEVAKSESSGVFRRVSKCSNSYEYFTHSATDRTEMETTPFTVVQALTSMPRFLLEFRDRDLEQ